MERLQKMIAQSGMTSRRKAEQLIIEGKVKVNGEVVTKLGTKVSSQDKIEVEGIPLEHEEKVYYLFYKPRGVISAVSDDKGRKVVADYFGDVAQRVYPVGRLDYDTSGLLLVTNDGEFANLLMHPRYEIDKTYIAKVDGIPSKLELKQLEKGIRLEEGITAPAKAKLLSADKRKKKAIVQLTIHEGRNRQVRRMFDKIGYPVEKLRREAYGTLTLKGLNAGEKRELSPHEVKTLRALAQNGAKASK
ncbi:ribosomal large subunit pseudouridine synthase B [Weizmannia acidilactici]|uniref:Pseudouridine synthase n=1 Tax=Weizmannia acidilactici TaxID=2607726 RepID=A0A5J4JC12_9BACI|nr:pseudouridine synthase [Weizmannia acidilactici]GER66064.1 ribosomal large subunit pseudouridine synthase B [Weizmannia acidilactici]GER69301.1 ribosomal large subunit pseudouridine synthase B [Weizmannia acidilactici]GER72373.1 ribosomal large subunit pseudouridine synthase B [Weizmannia acidilactici]